MVTKSLPTFKHTSIGAKTHKARTATAHVSYIMRSDAMTTFQAENMPHGGRGTRVYFDRQWEKAGMAENARIADKLMLALPIELSQEQRYALVQSFMRELGKGRIAWCAAHHDAGEDAHNPHAHVIFKDADIDTGSKVIGTTTNSRDVREAKENGWKVPPRTTTAEMRQRWCDHINKHMERAGLEVRYDPRTLKEQGIKRKPQIHVGPKAEALNEKGYQFESHDRLRGERAIPYTMYDQDSRARHNAQVIEANRRNEQGKERNSREDSRKDTLPHPESRKEREKGEMREAQGHAKYAMHQEQKRDHDALRQAQNAAKLELKAWASQFYARTREAAYQSVGKEYAEKWEKLRTADGPKRRAEQAAALKLEQKRSYERETSRQLKQYRQTKDAAWKTLQGQEKERLDLRTAHQRETTALARQHVAERFALEERWRAHSLAKLADRIDARLTAHQGMAAQQRAALETIKLHNRANQTAGIAGPVPILSNPKEAARAYSETARLEQSKQVSIRDQLLEHRAENLRRASAASREHREFSTKRAGMAGRARTNAAPAGRSSPREIVAPALRSAKGSRTAGIPKRIREGSAQEQIRQAATSGRPLTDGERVNASPDVKQQLDREQRREAIRWVLSSSSDQQQQRGKGRPGGGRGR